ncbi:phosphotransferase [Williamsia muralis]|uniref:Aminoglycoside phosphotransferase domain-containing protein n=1 Tax=Williamsia marianensis TaxID=85044 RepID=A0A2G3PR59_WILMA|nr:phosphotransferase [Williamsia marianensis]PHV68348.1 hypothetical protein CSW57_03700 [Williamsia marianensis]
MTKPVFRRQEKQLLSSIAHVIPQLGRDVDEITEVKPLLGRNISGQITFEGSHTVFIKRMTGLGAADRYIRSVSFHDAIDVSDAPAHTATPALLARDNDSHTVVYEFIDNGVSAGQLLRDDDIDSATLERVGRCVAGLHCLPVRDASVTDHSTPFFPPHGPNAISTQMYYGSTMGQLDMWRIIQSDSGLRAALDQLATTPTPKVPIHGDLRGDQILLAGETNWILDWEDFRLQDGARDVGALMGEVFYHRMRKSLASFAGGDEESVTDTEIIERGTAALAEATPGARAVWDAYRAVRADAAAPEFVARSVQYFGWQLFDRALAAGTYFGRLSALDRALAGIGREAILGGGDYAEALGMTEGRVAA